MECGLRTPTEKTGRTGGVASALLEDFKRGRISDYKSTEDLRLREGSPWEDPGPTLDLLASGLWLMTCASHRIVIIGTLGAMLRIEPGLKGRS
jgi:hypothetical protein